LLLGGINPAKPIT